MISFAAPWLFLLEMYNKTLTMGRAHVSASDAQSRISYVNHYQIFEGWETQEEDM
jgi:hypothetical protein